MPTHSPGILLQLRRGPESLGKLAFHGDLIRIGRDPRSEVTLPDRSVSRLHARIERTPAGFAIVDNGSSNGTLVNGRSCEERDLESGDLIEIGPFQLWVELLSGARLELLEEANLNEPTVRGSEDRLHDGC